MGYASRLNPASVDCELSPAEQNARLHRSLRTMLNQFPDRAAYEHWLAVRKVDDRMRAHMEQFLPEGLKATGTA
jgi:hypothetical protein